MEYAEHLLLVCDRTRAASGIYLLQHVEDVRMDRAQFFLAVVVLMGIVFYVSL